MPDRIKFLQGYRGKLTQEAYIEAGQVVEVGEEVADYLEANGVAERTRDEATYGLYGPLEDGAGQPEPDSRKANPPTREEELLAMTNAKLSEMLSQAGREPGFLKGLNKKALVEEILKLEAGELPVIEPSGDGVSAETGETSPPAEGPATS